VRAFFAERGYEEVETPCLVPAPGMEPHIDAFCAPFRPERGGSATPLWLHSSPEYAMKRLLSDGFERVFQLARVFRNGEVSATHNPEFTLLEFYRAGAGADAIMAELEALLERCARALTGGARVAAAAGPLDLAAPYPRVAMAELFARHAGGLDLAACEGDGERLRAALLARGLDTGAPGDGYDDLFFRTFLTLVEPALAAEGRPVYATDWPAPLAALARVRPDDPRFAERFELYAGGLELANGWTELTDAREQRRRLEEERALRLRLGRPAYPLDEAFLAALERMPEAGGVAVGLDRVLMLLTGARSIDEVLLFPAREFLP
jgi:lysyl-tRNA synthetase class 2